MTRSWMIGVNAFPSMPVRYRRVTASPAGVRSWSSCQVYPASSRIVRAFSTSPEPRVSSAIWSVQYSESGRNSTFCIVSMSAYADP